MKGILKKVLVTLMIIVALTSTGILVAYYYIDANNLWPTTLTSVIAGEITDKDGNSYPFIEMNYYADKSDNGNSLFEIRFNFFTGIDKQTVRGYTLQKFDVNKSTTYNTSDGRKVVNAYENYDEGSWAALAELEYGKNAYPMVFDIDGVTYGFFLDGSYEKTEYRYPSLLAMKWAQNITGNIEQYKHVFTYEYSYVDFFYAAFETLTKNSFGEGDFTMPIVNLAEYFSVGQYDENTKQWTDLPETSHVYTAVKIDGHYSKNNVRYARQSLINQIEGDGNWTFDGGELQDYSKLQFEKNLSINDFEMRYSESEGGYWLELPSDLIGEINRAGDFIVNINLNLDNTTNKILGFDFYAIDGLAVNNLTISASTPQDFILKPSWSANSTIKNTTHPNITIVDEGGAQ